MIVFPRVYIIFILFLYVATSCAATTVNDFKKKIRTINAELDSLKKHEGREVAALDADERKIAVFASLLKTLSSREDSLRLGVSALEDSASGQKKLWKNRESVLYQTLRQMYFLDQATVVEFAFFSDSISQVAEALVYLDVIAKTREQQIDAAQSAWRRYTAIATSLRNKKDSLANVIVLRKSSLDSVKNAKNAHSKKLKQIRSDKTARLKMLATLENSMRELERKLAAQKGDGGSFSVLRGKLPCPLGGTSCKVLKPFGVVTDAKYGTKFNNPGVDFVASAGQKVQCVAEGTVIDVVWLAGYQNVAIVNHGGSYFTVYGNLDATFVERGQKVKAGQILGEVSAESWLDDKPKLHFEIRRGKNKENPVQWLRK